MKPGGQNSRYSTTTPEGEILDITMEVTRSKYKPHDISGVLVLLRDVTEMRRMEKLKDEFVANVSHELRTPLTVISGFVETLKGWEALTANDRHTALNIIEVETERLKKLISEILLLSRIEGEMSHARKRLIPLAESVNQSAAALQPLADKKHITLKREIADPLEPLYGIAGWFRQIVYNLLDNAIKYTPPGGTVTVRLNTDRNRLCLEVEDTGPGIPREDRERIFERFYRREKSRQRKIAGSGIGLTITRHMVTEFGGTLELADSHPQGSLFRVYLPYRQESSPIIIRSTTP
jgi:two-component system phosphate regulon sensor histidine kinase PhoR